MIMVVVKGCQGVGGGGVDFSLIILVFGSGSGDFGAWICLKKKSNPAVFARYQLVLRWQSSGFIIPQDNGCYWLTASILNVFASGIQTNDSPLLKVMQPSLRVTFSQSLKTSSFPLV